MFRDVHVNKQGCNDKGFGILIWFDLMKNMINCHGTSTGNPKLKVKLP
jgi:hypothetical protein